MGKLITLTVLLFVISLPAVAQEVRTHTVQQGETLFRIAQEYGLPVDELRALNELEGDVLRVGQELVVSHGEEVEEEEVEATRVHIEEGERVDEQSYRSGTGDTFFSIADRLEMTADTLAVLNESLVARPLEAGIIINLPRAAHASITHQVESGQTLSTIAAQYGVSVAALRDANELQGDIIGVGQELEIPGSGTPEQERETFSEEGNVAVYPGAFSGRMTASGETYDPERFTASHPSLPFGTVVLITNEATDRKSFALVNDRGPVDRNLVMEISSAVAEELGLTQDDDQPVSVRLVE